MVPHYLFVFRFFFLKVKLYLEVCKGTTLFVFLAALSRFLRGESARMKIEEKGKHNALVTIKFDIQRKLLQKIDFKLLKVLKFTDYTYSKIEFIQCSCFHSRLTIAIYFYL